jgi:hypothetical protein
VSFSAADAAWMKSAREYVLIGEKLVGPGECLDLRAAPALISIGFTGGLRAGSHAIVRVAQAERHPHRPRHLQGEHRGSDLRLLHGPAHALRQYAGEFHDVRHGHVG